jgi:hypothetical protein
MVSNDSEPGPALRWCRAIACSTLKLVRMDPIQITGKNSEFIYGSSQHPQQANNEKAPEVEQA